MTRVLETEQGELERKVREDIRSSCKEYLIGGTLYSGSIDVDPKYRQKVIGYLKIHQQDYGNLHPAELEQIHDTDSIVLMIFTEEQAINLARGIDKARSTKEEPLTYVIGMSALTSRAYLT